MTNPAEVCTASNICQGDDRIASWEIDWNSDLSLHNWQEKLDLMCEPEWKVKMMVSSYFIGWCVTLLWLPLLSDGFGRKKFVSFGNLFNLLLYTIMLGITNINVMIGIIFCFGALASCRITIGIPYFMELLPKKNRQLAFTACAIVDVSVFLVGTIYFWKISTNWFTFCMIGYILQMFASIAACFLPESPVFLISKRRLEETRRSLRTIAWMNDSDFAPIQSFDFI